MIETKNDMQFVDERLLADEWQTTATPEPESITHLFGLYGKATEKTEKGGSVWRARRGQTVSSVA